MYVNNHINIYNNQLLQNYGKKNISRKSVVKYTDLPKYKSIYDLKSSQIPFMGVVGFEKLSAKRLNMIEGCLLGGAIGDALGAKIEPLPYNEIQKKYGEQGLHYIPKQDGVYRVTDDTQMTLFTAEGLLNSFLVNHNLNTEPNYQTVYDSYKDWYKTQSKTINQNVHQHGLLSDPALYVKRSPGKTCLDALKSGTMGTIEKPINTSYANGGIMRSAPIGLVYSKNPELAFKVGAKCAALTHGHPDAYLSAGCFSSIIAHIINGEKLEDAINASIETLKTYKGHEYTLECIEKAIELSKKGEYPPHAIKEIGAGFNGAEALGIALFSVLRYPDNFKHAIITAVNHDGDSDTTGAIAGNLSGLLNGRTNMPYGWCLNVEHSSWIGKHSKAINSILQISKPADKKSGIEKRWDSDKLI